MPSPRLSGLFCFSGRRVVPIAAALLATLSDCQLARHDSRPSRIPDVVSARADRAGNASPAGLTFPVADGGEPSRGWRERRGVSRTDLWAAWNSLRGDPYELDGVERIIDDGARITCSPQSLVNHGGTVLPYRGVVRVDPAFVERLVRFEQLVVEVATEIYGRGPARLRHFGAYSCRSTRNRSYRMSEHALGNAIDVVGFDFARATKKDVLAPGLPRELRGPFQVRVVRHWDGDARGPSAAVHAHFLRELAARLSDRSDVFRGMIGPSRSDHADHFHFDMSPWRYVYF